MEEIVNRAELNNASMPVKNIRLVIVVTLVFFLFLFYFFFGSGWYPGSELVIEGIAPKSGIGLVIRWDSGEGFNNYEREQFVLDTIWPNGSPEHSIVIRKTGQKGGGSLGSDVGLYGIRLDQQREVPLKNFISSTTTIDDRGLLKFKEPGAEIRLHATAMRHIRFEFPTNNYSGSVEIEVNGSTRTYDLYTTNSENRKRGDEHTRGIDYWVIAPDGKFTVTMPVPRYRIEAMVVESKDGKTPIRFQSIFLKSRYSQKSLPIKIEPARKIVLNDFDSGRKRFWHPNQFIFQCAFAGLSAWILLVLWGVVRKFSGPYDMFIKNKRYIFWLMFGGTILVFSLWLVAFWPGVMSVDSLKVWRAAKIPGFFLNDHPILNVVFFMYLMHIWDNVAVVPITQIVLVSLLVSHIFFSLYRKGIPIAALLPFYLLFIFSIPIGLYNIVLWKDIPFALLVTFWAYMLADMFYQKRKQTLSISTHRWAVLFLLYLSLALFRHNGALYLLVVPLLMMITGIISVKQVAIAAVVLASIGAAGFFTLRYRTKAMNSHYFLGMASGFLSQIRQQPLGQVIKRAAANYFFILNINQKDSKWDLWHFYLRDRHAYDFLKRVGWNDIYPYLKPNQYPVKWLHDLGLKIYKQTYKTPWVYLTWNPVYMLGLFLMAIVLFWLFPMSAIFSLFVVTQIIALLLIFSLNWRYFYFAVFSSYFLIPLMILDLRNKKA